MKAKLWAVLAGLGVAWAAAGCSNVASRVQRHQAAFDSWPADVQRNVQAGRITLGFTPEMVRVALGDPERIMVRTTEEGRAEVWVYYNRGPRFALGIGMGAAARHGGYAGGIGVGGGSADEEILRVIFEGGKVSAVESAK